MNEMGVSAIALLQMRQVLSFFISRKKRMNWMDCESIMLFRASLDRSVTKLEMRGYDKTTLFDFVAVRYLQQERQEVVPNGAEVPNHLVRHSLSPTARAR